MNELCIATPQNRSPAAASVFAPITFFLMKQIYSHAELLALRHECLELLVKSFFVTYRSHCVFLELHSPTGFPAFLYIYANAPTRPSQRYAFERGYGTNTARIAADDTPVSFLLENNAETYTENSHDNVIKPPLESYQLVKVLLSLGELPPGSKIIKARPGIPVPSNAIPISIADPTPGKSKNYEPKYIPPKRWNAKKISRNFGSTNVGGVTCFTPGGNDTQTYFAATDGAAARDASTVAAGSAGTRVDHATWASSETRATLETKFQYAQYFEPYMTKRLDAEGLKDKNPLALKKHGTVPAAITPSTSCESESTEYSSDSSNIQIQLPS